MRLEVSWSRFGRALDEPDQVASQFSESSQDLAGGRHGDKEPARQGAFQMREGVGSVEFVIVGSVVDRGGFDNGDCMKVVGKNFGADILTCSQPGQARGVLQR